MARRIREVRARIVGRREFIRLGGAAVAAGLWVACDSPADGDATGVGDPGDGLGAVDSSDDATPDERRVDERTEDPRGGVDDTLVADETVAPDIELPLYPAGVPEEIAPLSTNEEFYIVQKYGAADVDPDTWTLALKVEGETLASFDRAWLETVEARQKEHTLQCIESKPLIPRMNNAIWTGLPLLEVLDLLGVTWDDSIQFVQVVCHDNYLLGAPISDLELGMWLVWEMNGEPLPADHGYPVRLLVPTKFGWKNAKQLKWLNFLSWDPTPLQQKKWATDYVVQTLIVTPDSVGLVEEESRIRVLGKAYGGGDPVDLVELTVDDGETWAPAELTYAPAEPDIWTLWRWEWVPPEAGVYTIRARCSTQGGRVTDPAADLGDTPWVGGMAIEVEVVI